VNGACSIPASVVHEKDRPERGRLRKGLEDEKGKDRKAGGGAGPRCATGPWMRGRDHEGTVPGRSACSSMTGGQRPARGDDGGYWPVQTRNASRAAPRLPTARCSRAGLARKPRTRRGSQQGTVTGSSGAAHDDGNDPGALLPAPRALLAGSADGCTVRTRMMWRAALHHGLLGAVARREHGAVIRLAGLGRLRETRWATRTAASCCAPPRSPGPGLHAAASPLQDLSIRGSPVHQVRAGHRHDHLHRRVLHRGRDPGRGARSPARGASGKTCAAGHDHRA